MPNVLLALLVAIISANVSAGPYEAPFTADPPIIDGETDDAVWTRAPWKAIDKLILGAAPNAEDFSGRYKVVWTASDLYLLAEIIDDVLYDGHPDPLESYWDDDTLEIFIDEDNSGGDHLHSYNAFAYHIALDNQVVDIGPFLSAADEKAGRYNRRTYPEHVQARWKRSLDEPHKIYWEARISVYGDDYQDQYSKGESPAVPVQLENGKTLGFMVAYCDNDGSDSREHFIGDVEIEPVNGDRNLGYIDASVFGRLVLVNEP